MGEKCGSEVADDVDEYDRDNRIETYYQGWGAREMAERIVELEDELGADVDGICTGMHADVAEAWAEIERLKSLVGYWEHRAEESQRAVETLEGVADSAIRERNEAEERADVNCEVAGQWAELAERRRFAWLSARRRASRNAGAWRMSAHTVRHYRRITTGLNETLREVLDILCARREERDRYRLAWLSARRRAADEANYGAEALELKRQEISRLRAALYEARKTTHGPRLECVGPDGEGGEVWRVVDDSKKP